MKLDSLQEKLLLYSSDYYHWDSIYAKQGLEASKKPPNNFSPASHPRSLSSSSSSPPLSSTSGSGGSGGPNIIRGQIFVPYSIPEILSVLADIRYRKELEPSIAKCPSPQWLSTHTAVEYILYHPVWPTTPRDACNILHWRLLKNGLFLYYACAEEPLLSSSSLYPEKPNLVRSHLTVGGYVMRHVPGGTLLFLIVEVTHFPASHPSSLPHSDSLLNRLTLQGVSQRQWRT
jgi:hypothetical protein